MHVPPGDTGGARGRLRVYLGAAPGGWQDLQDAGGSRLPPYLPCQPRPLADTVRLAPLGIRIRCGAVRCGATASGVRSRRRSASCREQGVESSAEVRHTRRRPTPTTESRRRCRTNAAAATVRRPHAVALGVLGFHDPCRVVESSSRCGSQACRPDRLRRPDDGHTFPSRRETNSLVQHA